MIVQMKSVMEAKTNKLLMRTNISKSLSFETKIDSGIFWSFTYSNQDLFLNSNLFDLINTAMKNRDWLSLFVNKI